MLPNITESSIMDVRYVFLFSKKVIDFISPNDRGYPKLPEAYARAILAKAAWPKPCNRC
jgi:hypothetical protein